MTKLKTLSFPFTLKEMSPDPEPDEPQDMPEEQSEPAATDEAAADEKAVGIFAGYASTWDQDLYDDVIMPGAFADTLAAQYPDGGAHIPIHWQHKDGSPFDVIGETISAVEDDKGLYVEARLDLDTDEGARAYQLLQRGLIHQMSIGFLIEECSYVGGEDDDWDWDHREIGKVKLFEISLVQVAGNQGAEITEVRAAATDVVRKDGPTPTADPAGLVEETKQTSGHGAPRNGKDGDTMDMASQLAARKQDAATLIAKGADRLTGDEYAQLKAINADIKELEDNLEVFKQAADSISLVATDTRKEQPMHATSLGDLYMKGLESKGMSVLDTKHAGFRSAEFKAAGTTHQTDETTGTDGEGYAPLTTQIDQQGVFAYQRPLTVAALFDQGTMSGSAVKYPVYGALEGGAGTVKQGAKKPQLHMPAPEWITDTLHEIAAYWKISDDMAEDTPYVVSEINSHAAYDLQLVEETQLLSGDGTDPNLTGLLNRSIQTMGKDDDTDADRIFKAFTKVSEATGYPVDAIVINPADYQAIRLSKDANGQYYGGGPFAGGATIVPLWGVNTVVTPAVAAGTVVVGAFKLGGTVFRKGGLVVESSNSNEDDFINDKIAFRVKERVALQVKYPKAFVKVTLGAKAAATQGGKTD